MKKLIGAILSIVIILLIGTFSYKIYSDYIERQNEPVVSTMDFQGALNDIGELATAEYGFRITQIADKPNKTVIGLEIPFTDSKVIYSYSGVIKAGIDFEKIEVNFNEVNSTIAIDLPKVKILSSDIDTDSLIVYDEKYSPFNTFTFEDMNLSIDILKETTIESAVSEGLLDRGKENAEMIIRATVVNMLNTEGYKITIRWV